MGRMTTRICYQMMKKYLVGIEQGVSSITERCQAARISADTIGDSTPGVMAHTRRGTSTYYRSDRVTPQQEEFMEPIDLELDFGEHPFTSSAARGEAFGETSGDISFDAGPGEL
jgi:hypothetical protein